MAPVSGSPSASGAIAATTGSGPGAGQAACRARSISAASRGVGPASPARAGSARRHRAVALGSARGIRNIAPVCPADRGGVMMALPPPVPLWQKRQP